MSSSRLYLPSVVELSDLDRAALAFVAREGRIMEKWRASRLMAAGAGSPEKDLPAPPPAIFDMQNEDGGWRREAEEGGGALSNTGMAASALLDLVVAGLGEHPATHRTIAYLWQTQKEDGRWTEDPAQTDLPPWNQPGDVRVDLWETANIAAALVVLGYGSNSRVLRAVSWVQAQGEQDGEFPGFQHTTFATVTIRHCLGEQAAAQRHLGASLRLLREGETQPWFDTMELTWPLRLWAVGGIPASDPVVRAYLDSLRARRLPDGRWPTRYAGFETQYTLHAVELLLAYDSAEDPLRWRTTAFEAT